MQKLIFSKLVSLITFYDSAVMAELNLLLPFSENPLTTQEINNSSEFLSELNAVLNGPLFAGVPEESHLNVLFLINNALPEYQGLHPLTPSRSLNLFFDFCLKDMGIRNTHLTLSKKHVFSVRFEATIILDGFIYSVEELKTIFETSGNTINNPELTELNKAKKVLEYAIFSEEARRSILAHPVLGPIVESIERAQQEISMDLIRQDNVTLFLFKQTTLAITDIMDSEEDEESKSIQVQELLAELLVQINSLNSFDQPRLKEWLNYIIKVPYTMGGQHFFRLEDILSDPPHRQICLADKLTALWQFIRTIEPATEVPMQVKNIAFSQSMWLGISGLFVKESELLLAGRRNDRQHYLISLVKQDSFATFTDLLNQAEMDIKYNIPGLLYLLVILDDDMASKIIAEENLVIALFHQLPIYGRIEEEIAPVESRHPLFYSLGVFKKIIEKNFEAIKIAINILDMVKELLEIAIQNKNDLFSSWSLLVIRNIACRDPQIIEIVANTPGVFEALYAILLREFPICSQAAAMVLGLIIESQPQMVKPIADTPGVIDTFANLLVCKRENWVVAGGMGEAIYFMISSYPEIAENLANRPKFLEHLCAVVFQKNNAFAAGRAGQALGVLIKFQPDILDKIDIEKVIDTLTELTQSNEGKTNIRATEALESINEQRPSYRPYAS